jgi:MFS family permease
LKVERPGVPSKEEIEGKYKDKTPMDNANVTTTTKPKRRWLSATVLSAAAFVDSTENWTLSILWPNIYRSLSVSVDRLGSVLGISDLVRTLTLPLWGYLADRFSRKTLLVGMTGIWGLWTLAISFVQSLSQLYVVRILSSLGLGVLWPTAFSLLSDLFESKERGRATGLMVAISYLGSISSYAILPPIAARSPEAWRTGFIIMGLASAASGLLLLLINDPPRGSSEPELSDIIDEEAAARFAFRISDLPHLARIHTWWVMLIHSAIDQVALAVLFGWAFTWLDEIGLAESAFIAIALISLGNLIGHIFFGWLGDMLEKRSPDRGRASMAIVGLFVSIPALAGFIAFGERGLPYLIPFGFIAGLSLSSIGSGAQWPITQGVLRPELRASGRASLDMATGIVGSLSLTFSGFLVSRFDVTTMMLFMIPLPKLLSALAWIFIFKTYPRDRNILHGELSMRRETLLKETESGDHSNR